MIAATRVKCWDGYCVSRRYAWRVNDTAKQPCYDTLDKGHLLRVTRLHRY